MAGRERDKQREKLWRDVQARFRKSGLSVRAFCRQEQLSPALFYAWRRTIAQRNATISRRGRPRGSQVRGLIHRPPAFLPVLVGDDTPSHSGSDVAVELRGGRRLRFSDSIPVERLAAIVRALEAAPIAEEEQA